MILSKLKPISVFKDFPHTNKVKMKHLVLLAIFGVAIMVIYLLKQTS